MRCTRMESVVDPNQGVWIHQPITVASPSAARAKHLPKMATCSMSSFVADLSRAVAWSFLRGLPPSPRAFLPLVLESVRLGLVPTL